MNCAHKEANYLPQHIIIMMFANLFLQCSTYLYDENYMIIATRMTTPTHVAMYNCIVYSYSYVGFGYAKQIDPLADKNIQL